MNNSWEINRKIPKRNILRVRVSFFLRVTNKNSGKNLSVFNHLHELAVDLPFPSDSVSAGRQKCTLIAPLNAAISTIHLIILTFILDTLKIDHDHKSPTPVSNIRWNVHKWIIQTAYQWAVFPGISSHRGRGFQPEGCRLRSVCPESEWK